MTLLIAGVLAFILVHLIPVTPLRDSLRARLGKPVYGAGFGLLALASVALIVYGWMQAPFIGLWQPPAWGRSLAFVMVPLAFVLAISHHWTCNISRLKLHPLLLGILLWAIAHLLANGDQASLILFGGFAVYALLGMFAHKVRNTWQPGPAQPFWRDIVALVAAILISGALVHLHGILFGMPLVG